MSRIKKILNKHPFLFALSALIHHRKEKDYLRLFSDVQRAVTIDTKPNNLGKAPVCVFDATDKIGLFAFLRRVTEFLYYCDNMGFTPYIKWTASDYKDETISNTNNAFEYYYKQPGNINEIALNDSAVVEYSPGSLTMARSFIASDLYHPNKEFIEKMGEEASKYLVLKEEVASYIDGFIAEQSIDETTLGVHIRGTDFKKVYRHHPVFIETEDYYPFIEEALSGSNYKNIFLATDDDEILQSFIKHFKNIEIIYTKNTVRGNGVLGIHKMAAFNNAISPYREGQNALCDVYSLAACGGLISGVSHVSMFARIIKASKKEIFTYDKILDKGLHKKGINAVKEKFKEETNK